MSLDSQAVCHVCCVQQMSYIMCLYTVRISHFLTFSPVSSSFALADRAIIHRWRSHTNDIRIVEWDRWMPFRNIASNNFGWLMRVGHVVAWCWRECRLRSSTRIGTPCMTESWEASCTWPSFWCLVSDMYGIAQIGFGNELLLSQLVSCLETCQLRFKSSW